MDDVAEGWLVWYKLRITHISGGILPLQGIILSPEPNLDTHTPCRRPWSCQRDCGI